MDKRLEIHTGITKEQAYTLMLEGHKIAHKYYADDEYLYMIGGTIYDENGYNMGNYMDEFWNARQKWEFGWRTFNGV